jgi:hypothetical protein
MRFFYSISMLLLFLVLALLHFAGCGGVEVDGEQVDGGQPCTAQTVQQAHDQGCAGAGPTLSYAYSLDGLCTAYTVCGP